jgi:hypothetical protein
MFIAWWWNWTTTLMTRREVESPRDVADYFRHSWFVRALESGVSAMVSSHGEVVFASKVHLPSFFLIPPGGPISLLPFVVCVCQPIYCRRTSRRTMLHFDLAWRIVNIWSSPSFSYLNAFPPIPQHIVHNPRAASSLFYYTLFLLEQNICLEMQAN